MLTLLLFELLLKTDGATDKKIKMDFGQTVRLWRYLFCKR